MRSSRHGLTMTLHPDNADPHAAPARRMARRTLTARGEKRPMRPHRSPLMQASAASPDHHRPEPGSSSTHRPSGRTTRASSRSAWLERVRLPAARVLPSTRTRAFVRVGSRRRHARAATASNAGIVRLYTRAVDVLIDLQAAALETPTGSRLRRRSLALENAIFGDGSFRGCSICRPRLRC